MTFDPNTFDPLAHTRATAQSGGDFVKFDNLGDAVTLTIERTRPYTFPPDRSGKAGDTCTVLDGKDENGQDKSLALTGHRGSAFLDAVAASQATRVDPGSVLIMQYHATKDTGQIQPMKLYRAHYTPAVAQGPAVSDLFPTAPAAFPPQPQQAPQPAPQQAPVQAPWPPQAPAGATAPQQAPQPQPGSHVPLEWQNEPVQAPPAPPQQWGPQGAQSPTPPWQQPEAPQAPRNLDGLFGGS